MRARWLKASWFVSLSVASVGGLAACDPSKSEPVGPDYGVEDALESKLDSALLPSRREAVRLGDVKTARFTRDAQYTAFVFEGARNQTVDLYVDGLAGLDTIVYLYKVSRTTGRPFGTPLAQNDDTPIGGWTLRTGRAPNPLSSSIVAFKLPEARRYALVATTYARAVGTAEAVVRSGGVSVPLVTLDVLRRDRAAYEGRAVRVQGEVSLGVLACTKIGCPTSNPCCNRCSAGFQFANDIRLWGAENAPLSCSGNECAQNACTGFPSREPGRYEVRARVRRADPAVTEIILLVDSVSALDCQRGGCSGQMCANGPGGVSTCEYRPEYACYRAAQCTAQSAGHCGFTPTPTLTACLANPPRE